MTLNEFYSMCVQDPEDKEYSEECNGVKIYVFTTEGSGGVEGFLNGEGEPSFTISSTRSLDCFLRTIYLSAEVLKIVAVQQDRIAVLVEV